MSYIDGFITPVATAARARFAEHARAAASIVRERGAIRVVDTWGEDVPAGKRNDIAGAVRLEPNESPSFGWIEFADRPARDAFGAAIVADERLAALGLPPFDFSRMILGGFEVIVDTGRGAAPGFIDGYVLPVAVVDREAYRAFAASASAVFLDHGAIRHVEAWGDDVPAGDTVDFSRAALAQDDEAVVFAWVEWPDRAARDRATPLVMADERMANLPTPLPCDGQRMIFGGFAVLNDA
jgi:uncharacterized protein YbaA (DUF1428 family)